MRYLVLISIIVILILPSCKRENKKTSNPEYFDEVFRRAEAISSTNPQGAFCFLDSAFDEFPGPGIQDLYRKYAFKENVLTGYNSKPNANALFYADSMLLVLGDHIAEKEFIPQYARALFLKAKILAWKKDFAGALDYGNKARLAIEEIKDSCMLSSYTILVAGISFRQQKYLDAIKYFKQCLREVRSCPDDYNRFLTIQSKIDDLGLAYAKAGLPDSALYYYLSDLDYLENQKHIYPGATDQTRFKEIAKGVVYGNIGDVYLAKGDTEEAEKYYKMDSNLHPGFDPGDAQCTNLKLIKLYLEQNETVNAADVLQQLRTSLDTLPDLETAIRWYQLKLEYLEKTGQSNEVFLYIKPYLQLRDSLDYITQLPQIDMEEQYAHVKDRNTLILLQKQNDLKNRYLFVVAMATLLAVIIAVLLWYNWKSSAAQNKKISKQNKELQLTLDALTQSQKENTHMMQIVAHDLKNPISSMIGVTTLLLENKNIAADDRAMLELMLSSNRNMVDMINDLQNMDTSRDEIKKEPVEIDVLLRYCADLLQFKANEKKQHISLQADPALLNISREKMWRVISNLIVNAIKFSFEGNDIYVSGLVRHYEYLIAVHDNGIGIPEEYAEDIFTMFSKAQRAGTRGEKSYGMGLAITRHIVEAHGGSIWFESEKGIGTTFFIALPM